MRLSEFARKNDLFVVNDSAQALGASWNGRKAGTFRDVGFYSLSKGKNITTIEGGIIVTNDDDIAQRIDPLVRVLRQSGRLASLALFAKSLMYALFLHPYLYRLPAQSPFIELGISEFDPAFKISDFTSWQASLGTQLLGKLDQLNQKRKENAERLSQQLRGYDGLILPQASSYSESVFVRLPVLVKEPSVREKLHKGLLRQGIGVSKMYPLALDQIPSLLPYLAGEKDRFPNARFVASHLLTLPTHPYLKESDREKIISLIGEATKGHERFYS
jgi:perosamine synthetase